MSLNVTTIHVTSNELTLRLTSKALMNFNLKHGSAGQSPVISVLSALDDIAARVDLFTNALNHPENHNVTRDGAVLLDMMADDPSWSRQEIDILILQMAQDCGLLSGEDFTNLLEPVRRNSEKLITVLAGLLGGSTNAADPAQVNTPVAQEENPT